MLNRLIIYGIGFSLLAGCSSGRRWAISQAAIPLVESGMTAILAEPDPQLAAQALPVHLKLLEAMIVNAPHNRDLLVAAAHGFTGYAMLFIEPEDHNRAKLFYQRAADYGFRVLMSSHSRINERDISFDEFERIVAGIDEADIDAAYWTAVAWGQRINLERGSPESLAEFPRVMAIMNRVLEINPHYYYSGPLWFFGAYYASMPPIAGGNLDKAREFFSRALSADGERFLWGRLLFAQTYAVQSLNRRLFIDELNYILKSDGDEPEQLKLLNAIARRRAANLITKVDDIF